MSPAAIIEICAAIAGIAGAAILAHKGPHAGWGFVAYLASNVAWIAFAWSNAHWGLLAQQVAFLVASVYGIWKWIVEPIVDSAFQEGDGT